MKKHAAISFVLALIMVFSAVGPAFAMKLGLAGSFGTSAWDTQPILVISPENMKDVKYDILLGYSSVGKGEDIDASIGMLLGGTWWAWQSGPISYGPSLIYYSQGTTYNGLDGDKASDNTITSLDLIFSVKTTLIPSVDIRADVIVLTSVSGKSGGSDLKSVNTMLDTIQLAIVYNFPI
jgi:hypothetical protein